MSGLFQFHHENVSRSRSVVDTDFEPIFWSDLSEKHVFVDKHPLQRYFILPLSGFGFVFNALVLIIVLSFDNLRNMRSTYLVISLTVADLLVCAGVMPLSHVMYTQEESRPDNPLNICTLWFFLTTFACTSSSLNMSMISIDRYIFITSSLTYERKMTRARIRLMLLVVWISAFLLAFTTFLLYLIPATRSSTHTSNNTAAANMTDGLELEVGKKCYMDLPPSYSIVSVSTVLFLPSFIVVVLHCKIYAVAKRHAKYLLSLRRLSVSFEASRSVQTSGNVSFVESNPLTLQETSSKSSSCQPAHHRGSLTKELQTSFITQETKASFVLSMVIGTYLACWLPFGAFVLVEISLQRTLDPDIKNILLVLGYSNSCWNPLIYFGFNKLFRSTVRHRLQRLKRIRRASQTWRTE